MQHHDIVKMRGKVIAAILVLFDDLDGDTEFREAFRQIKSGFTAARDHDFLQIGIFAALVDAVVQLGNFILFADQVEGIVILNDGVAMRNDDLTVSGNRYDQHVRQKIRHLPHGEVDQAAHSADIELDHGNLAAGKDTVGQCVFFDQILVDLERDGQIRIDNVVDIEGFLDKINLVHVLRISYARDDLGTAHLFGEGRDDHVLLIAVRTGDEKIKGIDAIASEQADLLGIADDGQYVVLMGNAIDDRFVFIYDGDRVIASG